MMILETERLILRHVTLDDVAFVFELMNDPSWIRFIGDRGIRTVDDARDYILNGYIKSYKQFGYGLYLTAVKPNTPIGICGLVNRPTLDDIDIGFAFLPQFTGQGYAYEAARAVLDHAKNDLNIPRIVAITAPDNERSGRLLEKLGLRFEKMIRLAPDGAESRFYVLARGN